MNNVTFNIRCLFCCLVFCLPATAGTIYVDANATGQNNGTTWDNAYTSLSAAIENASAVDEIWVTEGTYGPLVLKDGVEVYGGFAGTETTASASDPDGHKTYISGRGESRAVHSIGNDSSTVLRGFYITDGFIDSPDTGGGVYLEKSDAMFVRCVFTKNRSVTMGGAVAVFGGSPTFVNCRFHGNDGGWAAGAVFNHRSASPVFVNCLFYENTAWEGGAVSIVAGAPTFINCTIADNSATIGKAGALFDSRAEAMLYNCILWDNKSPVSRANEIYDKAVSGRTTTLAHSNIKGGWPGEGNMDRDPLFVDAASDDYRLQATSPCVDSGRNALLPNDVADLSTNGDTNEVLPKDLALKGRVSGDAVDMGAYEWHPPGE